MSERRLKPMFRLRKGEKFNFNDGRVTNNVWVVDAVRKDERFPREDIPKDIWAITYHMEHPDIDRPTPHTFYADTTDKVWVLVHY